MESKAVEGKRERNSFGIPTLPLGIQYKELIIFTCWLAAVGFTFWFIYYVSDHYQHAQHSPVTSLSLVETIPLDYPAITICNYNAHENCTDECGLELILTTRVGENGTALELTHDFEYKVIDSFHCAVINNSTHSNFPEAFMTGYGASIQMYFKLPKAPPGMLLRQGMQDTFHEQGTVPDLNAETNFAVVGKDNVFILTKVHTKRLRIAHESTGSSGSTHHSSRNLEEGHTESGSNSEENDSEYITTVRWDTAMSNIGLGMPEENLAVVSIAYATLNQYELEDQLTVTVQSVLGEIGAIIGVLAGVDLVKIFRGFFEIPFAIYLGSFRPIWEIYN